MALISEINSLKGIGNSLNVINCSYAAILHVVKNIKNKVNIPPMPARVEQ
jgi:hypothetical protein